MDLSIIIVNWNVEDYLRQCLEAIYKTVKDIEFEVFVVDNNSSDNSIEVIKQNFPQVNLIANKENYGFAKANNQAIITSKGKYVLLLNPDTVVLLNSIKSMVNFMDRHFDFGVVGPAIFLEDMQTVSPCGARNFPTIVKTFFNLTTLSRSFKIFNRNLERDWGGRENCLREVDVLSGACMMVRKKTIEEVGLLDEDFFMYGEDIDWCYRIKKAGWKLYYLASVGIIHYEDRSARQRYSETENMIKTFRTTSIL